MTEPTSSIPDHVALMMLGVTTASVAAAAGCGLLEALGEVPEPAEALAQRLGLNVFATGCVLDVLVQAGLAEREGDAYRASPALLSEPKGPAGSIAGLVQMWSALPEYLRSGQGFYFHGRNAASRERSYEGTVSRLGRLLAEPAHALAAALAQRGPAPATILDVGAGSGIWSLAMAKQHPSVHVTALDLPGVLDDFRVAAEALDLRARTDTIGADYHTVDLPPRRFDRVVMANVLHLEAPGDAARVLERLVPSVASEGELVIVDAMSDGSPASDRYVAAYALHLALRTGHGRPHPEAELREWLAAAGLGRVERIEPIRGMPGLAALVASR
jgi:SAM-dependent methyltransferase